MRRLVVCWFAALSAVFSQAAPQGGPSAETAKKATVEGVILNEVTREPLRRAEVSLFRAQKGGHLALGRDAAYSAVTDAEGKFRIENIDPGDYMVTPRKSGFLNSRSAFQFSSRNLKLGAGETQTSLRYGLAPQAIVTGRVLDDEGEPVQSVDVHLVRLRYARGALQTWQTMGRVQTNDRGEYRIVDVMPGRYLIQADAARLVYMEASAAVPVAGASRTAFIPTYYPSAAEPAQASRVDAQAGQELAGQDITLRKDKVVTVSGKVLTPDGSPAKQTMVLFAPNDETLGRFNRFGVPVDENGNFSDKSIRPGQYVLLTTQMNDQNRNAAQVPVSVGDNGVTNLVVQLVPGFEIKGTITLEGTDKKDYDFSGFSISLSAVDLANFSGGWGQAKSDGTFTLSPVWAGRHTIAVYTGSPETYIKSILVGGEDVYGKEFDSSSAAANGIRVVMRLDAAKVKGTVEIPEEKKASLRTPAAVLLSTDARLRKAMPFYYAPIDSSSTFDLKSVPPGEYLAFAFEDCDTSSFADPEVLAAIESQGTRVTFAANESKTLTLKLLPWPQQFADRLQ